MRLVIELLVDCIRCKRSETVYSSRTKVEGDPIATWTPTPDGWICPDDSEPECPDCGETPGSNADAGCEACEATIVEGA